MHHGIERLGVHTVDTLIAGAAHRRPRMPRVHVNDVLVSQWLEHMYAKAPHTVMHSRNGHPSNGVGAHRLLLMLL